MRYFGPGVRRFISYPLAATSGVVLAVCSCTILPLFAGIYRKGSGIGPATAFLYAGPAINVLAIIYTASVLGYDLGAARAISAVLMSMVIGVYMSLFFKKHDRDLANRARGPDNPQYPGNDRIRPRWTISLFFALMVLVLIVGASSLFWPVRLGIVTLLLGVLGGLLYIHFKKDELREWMLETWDLTRKIVPILVIGAFVIGAISEIIPPSVFKPILGGESLIANLTASVVGAILYMPTLLEVPIIDHTFGYSQGSMGAGPALSLLLAGPAVSLPNMIVLFRIMGLKKTFAYILMVIFFSTMAGYVYGNLIV
ncbi:MAG: permease [Thermoplasmatota archaeon]